MLHPLGLDDLRVLWILMPSQGGGRERVAGGSDRSCEDRNTRKRITLTLPSPIEGEGVRKSRREQRVE